MSGSKAVIKLSTMPPEMQVWIKPHVVFCFASRSLNLNPHCTPPPFSMSMQEFAVKCAIEGMSSKFTEQVFWTRKPLVVVSIKPCVVDRFIRLFQEIAGFIRQTFDQKYPATWHVLVGRNFGCFVTHEKSKFSYFYVGQMGVCMFATA